tara:strand:- start:3581 stop:3955 length:375 start_codon:yes stop_codon:yes gene_type:complete
MSDIKFFCQLKASTNEVLKVRLIGADVTGEDMSSQGEDYCSNTYGGVWKQTSETGSFRKNYGGVGWFYRSDLDAFIPAQPYPSWTLNTTTCNWEAPNPPGPAPFDPLDPVIYNWNESTQSWDSE